MSKFKIFVLGIRGFPDVQGGPERHSQELYPRLIRFGCDVTVFTRTPYIRRENRFFEWRGIKFIHIWSLRKKNFEVIIHTLLGSIVCLLKRPDIVHFHNIGPGLFIPLLKLARIKTVLTYHSINYEHQKWGRFARLILKLGEYLSIKFSDKVIVISRTAKEFLEKKYGRKDLEFIPNGVEILKVMPTGGNLKKYGLEAQRYIFTASRFTPEKGLHDLIEAYAKINNPEFKLVIAGDVDHEIDYSRRLKQKARKAGVILTGFISGDALTELYSNAALFVLPSYYEGLPIALLEAMSYGLPVLVSDIAQNREISLPEFRFFPSGEIDLLAKKMIELFKRGISEEEKTQQRKILEENYNWDRIAQQTLEVYKKLITHSS